MSVAASGFEQFVEAFWVVLHKRSHIISWRVATTNSVAQPYRLHLDILRSHVEFYIFLEKVNAKLYLVDQLVREKYDLKLLFMSGSEYKGKLGC